MLIKFLSFIGSSSTGIIVGYLLMYFLRRIKKFSVSGFSTIVTVLFGGVIIKYLETKAYIWWSYPLGIFVGMVVYITLACTIGKESFKDVALGMFLSPEEPPDTDS